jgi:hypothetical protein
LPTAGDTTEVGVEAGDVLGTPIRTDDEKEEEEAENANELECPASSSTKPISIREQHLATIPQTATTNSSSSMSFSTSLAADGEEEETIVMEDDAEEALMMHMDTNTTATSSPSTVRTFLIKCFMILSFIFSRFVNLM